MPTAALNHLVGMQRSRPPALFRPLDTVENFRAKNFPSERVEGLRLSRCLRNQLVTAKARGARRPAVGQDRHFSRERHGPALEGLDMATLMKLAKTREEKPSPHGTRQASAKAFGRPGIRSAMPRATISARLSPPRASGAGARQPAHRRSKVARRQSHRNFPDEMIFAKSRFGPASVRDAQAGPGAKLSVFERAAGYRSFRDETGREIFDLTRRPSPRSGSESAVRFAGIRQWLLSQATESIVREDDRNYLFGGAC